VASTIDLNDAASVIEALERAANAMRESPLRAGSTIRLPARGRLLATGDLHDNPYHLDAILRLAKLEASSDHHVVLHELIHGERLINGLDFSYRMLVRVASLVLERPDQVHPILANHELAQLTGRGISKGAGNSVELFNGALEYVFGDGHEEVADAVRLFLRALPLAALSDDSNGGGVCCAHSLPADHDLEDFDAGVLNRALTEEDYLSPNGAAHVMTWGRGLSPAGAERLARTWNVRLFCLGHDYVETGIECRGDRIVILNSDHERATALPIDLANVPGAEEALFRAIPLSSTERIRRPEHP